MRREKRYSKAEAKRGRKANVPRAAKWTDERRAADKLKKLANRPLKEEKRRKRMLVRYEKLKKQGAKMILEAEKALAQYKLLTQVKEVRSPPARSAWGGGGRADKADSVGHSRKRKPSGNGRLSRARRRTITSRLATTR